MTIKQKHICAPWRGAGGKIGNCIVCGRNMNSQHNRTFRLDRLYFQFLKPKGLSIELLHELQTLMIEHGFITMEDGLERYSETQKLTNRQNRDELFKIIERIKHG